jgi:hypothetical protein
MTLMSQWCQLRRVTQGTYGALGPDLAERDGDEGAAGVGHEEHDARETVRQRGLDENRGNPGVQPRVLVAHALAHDAREPEEAVADQGRDEDVEADRHGVVRRAEVDGLGAEEEPAGGEGGDELEDGEGCGKEGG